MAMAFSLNTRTEVPQLLEISDLRKLHLFGDLKRQSDFEFEWPQRGDLASLSLEKGTKIAQIKVLLNKWNFKGIQVVLSDGTLSPMFCQTYINPNDTSNK